MIERGLQKLRFFNRIKKTKRIPTCNVDARGIFAHKMLNLEKYSLIFSQITLCKSERRRIIEESRGERLR